MDFIDIKPSGITLREIIERLGNKSYKYIEFRCRWKDTDGKERDDFYGGASYDNKTKMLTPIDNDTYSLDDVYSNWREWIDLDEEFFDNGQECLTVWESETLPEMRKNA